MIRELFLKDLGWKVFSLLLAAFIWYTVHKIIEEPKLVALSPASSVVTYGEVPVYLVGAADLRGYGLNSNSVSVTISGPPGNMAILEKSLIHAVVNLADAPAPLPNGDRPVEVTVPWGVTVVSVEPAQLRVFPPKK